jgi:hypothetical protein
LVVVGLGTRHTLASYLSMQPAPETTESMGHFMRAALGEPAAPAEPVGTTVLARESPAAIALEMIPLRHGSRRPRSPRFVSSAFVSITFIGSLLLGLDVVRYGARHTPLRVVSLRVRPTAWRVSLRDSSAPGAFATAA